ncbi:MAG: glycosyltransferase, partial [Chloroflexota bacterium]
GTEPALRLRQELGLRCPVVLFAAGTMSKGADTLLFHWQPLLRPGDGLWFSSEADRAIWRRVVRRSALHEWVVPLGVDETLFRPRAPAERRAVREAHGLPPTAPLLLSVGRLNIQKNLHTLLRLLAAVRREVADAHLCFVGEEDGIGLHEFGVLNTGYVAWLRGQAAELGLADAVTFTGPLFGEDLAALYAAADVVVSASVNQRENGGLAQAEAQACGVPVVCSAWGGFKDVVRDGETGFLMEAVLIRHGIRVDWATGAAQVVALLHNPALRAAMGERAVAWARERYGLAAFGQALGRIADEVGTPPPGGESAGASGATGRAVSRAGRAQGSGTDQGTSDGGPSDVPFEPSAFAAPFEAHKRARGWYDPIVVARRGGYPPLFQGRVYRFYERLMVPYATRRASALGASQPAPEWVPYFPSPVVLDPVRQVAEDHDPIWPHRRFCRPDVWAVLRQVDGVASVESIVTAVTAERPAVDRRAVGAILRELHVEGFILFKRK